MEFSIKKIVLIEDDENITASLKISLSSQGFEVIHFESSEEYLSSELKASLYLLDINLPGMSGLELCRVIRKKDSLTPIIFLTANQNESIAVEALSSGSQDFVRKPFSIAELSARIKLHLKINIKDEIRLNDLLINAKNKAVYAQGTEIKLTKNEFHLLFNFLDNPDIIFNRDRLLQLISSSEDSSDRTIDTTISRLKNKLKKHTVESIQIQSVYGEGYLAKIKR